MQHAERCLRHDHEDGDDEQAKPGPEPRAEHLRLASGVLSIRLISRC